VESPVQTNYRTLLERLRKKIDDTLAVVLAGPDGLVDYLAVDPTLSIETVASEYAMLLRIAHRTSHDAQAGNLLEHIVVSERFIMVARTVAPEHFLILFCRRPDQIGRARYEVKQAAREIQI
jgi:predicted regulator of Ras-like GTPase activity (Roadblock/LC7/MglB family)